MQIPIEICLHIFDFFSMDIHSLINVFPCLNHYFFAYFFCKKDMLLMNKVIYNDEDYKRHLKIVLEYWDRAMLVRFKCTISQLDQSLMNRKNIKLITEQIEKDVKLFKQCANYISANESISEFQMDKVIYDLIHYLFFNVRSLFCFNSQCKSMNNFIIDENDAHEKLYDCSKQLQINLSCQLCNRCVSEVSHISKNGITYFTGIPTKLANYMPKFIEYRSRYKIQYCIQAILPFSCYFYGGVENTKIMLEHNMNKQKKMNETKEKNQIKFNDAKSKLFFLYNQIHNVDISNILVKYYLNQSSQTQVDIIEQWKANIAEALNKAQELMSKKRK